MEDVNLKNDPTKKMILDKLEYIFAILFTIELLLKLVGMGIVKYFTSLWCWLDFGIVVVSFFICYFLILSSYIQNESTFIKQRSFQS